MSRYIQIFSLFICVVLFALPGCGTIGSRTFKSTSSAYRDVVSQYGNENILLNIIRSAQEMPISFLDIPTIIGTGNLGASAGVFGNIYGSSPSSLGGFISPDSAYGLTYYAPSVGMSINNGFTFTQASLDNAQFMSSFLATIPAETLNFLSSHQNIPRSALYLLLIDSIELRTLDNKRIGLFNNNPLSQNFEDFQEVLYLLISSGLTTETIPVKTPVGPLLSSTSLLKPGSMLLESLLSKDNLQVEKPSYELAQVKVGNEIFFQVNKVIPTTRLCLNKYSAERLLGSRIGSAAFCADSPRIDEATEDYSKVLAMFDGNYPGSKNLQLIFRPRSTRNVFEYLGSIYLASQKTPPYVVRIRPLKNDMPPLAIRSSTDPAPLFIINKNSSNKNTVSEVDFNGDTYSISNENYSYTKPIMQLMSVLLTLDKLPASIPASPSVLVK